MNPALKPFWQTKADIKLLSGGRASSKTYDCAAFALYLASHFTLKFLCIRQFQSKIKESVYAILCSHIETFGYQGQFTVLNNEIIHNKTGSVFIFYGIARNIAEIKGTEGVDICWAEEMESLTKEQWSIIEPTIRKDNSEIWLLWNPRLVSDFIESFVHDPANGIIKRHINYDENPFLSDTMVRKIIRLKEADPEQYEHIYLGVAKTDDDDVIIKRSWIEAAVDAHIKLGIEIEGDRQIGFDVADSGSDLCAQIFRFGILAMWGEHWQGKEDELELSATRVYNKAVSLQAHISYDSIGIGANAGARFKTLNLERKATAGEKPVPYSKFIASGAVLNPKKLWLDDGMGEQITNKAFFENIKAQTWWILAERFRNTYNAINKGMIFADCDLISISSSMPNLANLITELSTPKKRFSKAAKVMVESKDELKAREVDSPNDADAFIMAYADKNMRNTLEW